MKLLWAPWRLKYILGAKEKDCIFCEKPKAGNDREHFILHRGKSNFIILNLYPYNNGHLMVVPYKHASGIGGIGPEEAAEMMELTQKSVGVLQRKFNPQGFNIGMNLGSAAGAGIEEHLHMHVVPRWNGDTNFMPVLGETKVMPQHIESTYDNLIDGFSGL